MAGQQPRKSGKTAKLREWISDRDRKISALMMLIDQMRAERGEHVNSPRRVRRATLVTYVLALQDTNRSLRERVRALEEQLLQGVARERHWHSEAQATAAACAELRGTLRALESQVAAPVP